MRLVLENLRLSSVYRTEPLEYLDQPEFLNACCTGSTRLTPPQLLAELQDIERCAGRRLGGPRFGPRVLDLDLLLCGERVISDPKLTVPHPRMRERAFVIVPLAEIAPEWVVCGQGEAESATVAQLSRRVDRSGIRPTRQSLR